MSSFVICRDARLGFLREDHCKSWCDEQVRCVVVNGIRGMESEVRIEKARSCKGSCACTNIVKSVTRLDCTTADRSRNVEAW